jgi:hypothetical protein
LLEWLESGNLSGYNPHKARYEILTCLSYEFHNIEAGILLIKKEVFPLWEIIGILFQYASYLSELLKLFDISVQTCMICYLLNIIEGLKYGQSI